MGRSTLRSDRPAAVAYVRVSTDEQALGPEAQRAAVTAWAAANGHDLVAVFEDLGISGGADLDDRPGLLAALDAVRHHGGAVLLVAKRDRLARDTFVSAMVERLVERAGARILAADGTGNGDGPEALLLRRMVDAFAEYERSLIRARTRAALRVKKDRRERTGSVPYGLRLDDDGVHLVVHPEEARVVALVAAGRAAGRSLREIAAQLTEAGHRPRGGRSWHVQTIANIARAA